MKKAFVLFVLLIFVCVGCSSKGNKDAETINEQKSLSDYPVIKESVDGIINQLKESSYFDKIIFKSVEENDDNEIEVIYLIEDTKLTLTYINNNFNKIEINYSNYSDIPLDKQQYSNQKLAITYLNEFNIKENDFDNSDEIHSYESYVKLIAGISDTYWVYTTKEKNLSIFCSENSVGNTFSISKGN